METLPSDSFPKYENMHSKLVSDYPNVTKEITMYDSLTGNSIIGKYYDVNVYDRQLAYVINKDGLVIFGGNTYCYTKDKIKVMTGTNSSNFSTLINSNTSNPLYGIVVYTVPLNPTPTGTTCSSTRNQWVTSVTKQGGPNNRYRSITYFGQDQDIGNNNDESITKYHVDIRTLQRRVLGLWWDNYTPKAVSLSWNITGNTVAHWSYQSGYWTSYSLQLNSSNTGKAFVPNTTINYTIPFNSGYGDVFSIYTKNCDDPELGVGSSVTSSVTVKNNNLLPLGTCFKP